MTQQMDATTIDKLETAAQGVAASTNTPTAELILRLHELDAVIATAASEQCEIVRVLKNRGARGGMPMDWNRTVSASALQDAVSKACRCRPGELDRAAKLVPAP